MVTNTATAVFMMHYDEL